jgi:nicotinate phosphoribosyltransferase
MAHSFVQAYDDEERAFFDFATANTDVVLLIDTYNTEEAAAKVARIAPQLRSQGIDVRGVRLDSGDLVDHARKVRHILDSAGLGNIKIFASGSFDEYELHKFEEVDAPIDGYGIGTRLSTSADAPYLDCAYKLQEYAGKPRLKRSEGKETWPGPKQVYRVYDAAGLIGNDLVTLESDAQQGEPLLMPVMRKGIRLPQPTISEIRDRVQCQIRCLPGQLRSLQQAEPFAVTISNQVRKLAAKFV